MAACNKLRKMLVNSNCVYFSLFWSFSGHSWKMKSKFILQVNDIFHNNFLMKLYQWNKFTLIINCLPFFKVAKKTLSNRLSLICSPGQITISQLIENMFKKCLLKGKSFANRQVSWILKSVTDANLYMKILFNTLSVQKTKTIFQ